MSGWLIRGLSISYFVIFNDDFLILLYRGFRVAY